MKIFRKVVETGSFTAAAKELRLSVAWTAKNIEKLENELGSTLLNRTTRSLHLTEAGEVCYQSAGLMLDQLTDLQERLGNDAETPSGKLKVSVPHIMAQSVFGEIIGEFALKYPDITIEINVDDRYVDIVDAGYDLAFRFTSSLQESTNIVRKAATFERVLCASPNYLRRYGRPEKPEELNDHRCIIYSWLAASDTWKFTIDGQKKHIRPKVHMSVNNTPLNKRIAMAGGGIVYLPFFLVKDELANGQLVSVIPHAACEPLDMYIIRPAGRFQSKKSKLFSNFVFNALKSYEAEIHI